MTPKKLQIFVSSTYSDLREERQAAVQAIVTAGHIPAGMELFAAGDQSQMDVIKRWIDESDVFLLILGGRYGSIEPVSNKSYIQLEYEYALQKNKAFFAVVIDEDHLKEKVRLHGSDVSETDNAKELKTFRAMVLTRLVKFWSDTKDIELAVHRTLSEFARRDELVGWVSGKRGGMLTRPVLENPRRLFCVDEIQCADPVVLDLFARLMAEGQLIERGSDKIADFSQCILIFTSSSNADELKRIQQELTDYDQIVKAVEKQSAQSEFFRPLFDGGIDRVFPFRELDAKALAEIALLKFSKMAEKDFGINVEFISQQSILDLLVSNYQVARLSVYGFERFFYDLFADDLVAAKENGARGVKLRVGTDGELSLLG